MGTEELAAALARAMNASGFSVADDSKWMHDLATHPAVKAALDAMVTAAVRAELEAAADELIRLETISTVSEGIWTDIAGWLRGRAAAVGAPGDAGTRDWTREPTARELGLADPPQLTAADYSEDGGA